MSIITQRRGGGTLEHYSFALTDMTRWGYQGLRNVGGSFGERESRGIPALGRAARLRAESVATLSLGCWRGDGADRVRVNGTWQARLFRSRPNDQQTRFGFWETVEESLAWRGNGFIWKTVSGGRVLEWYALHPDQVAPISGGGWKVTVADGYIDPVGKGPGVYAVDGSTILHIRGHGQGGQRLAPTPIEVYRDALQGPVGRQKHEARTWRRGSSVQVAVEFPANVNKDQAERWRDLWRNSYEGMDGESVAVIGGGGQIKPIGMTLADAAFVELAHLTVEDASRIMAVPANLLGVSILARGTPNLEQDLMTWFRFGLGPQLSRIEDALAADEQLFGTKALLAAETRGSLSLYPAFVTDDFVRGDLETEDNIVHQQIQDGRLLVDEWRQERGMPPLPGGVGSIPQIVPVGGAPNPNTGSQPADPDEDAKDDQAQTARALGTLEGRVDVLAAIAATPDAPAAPPAADAAIVAGLARVADTIREAAAIQPEPVAPQTDPALVAALHELASVYGELAAKPTPAPQVSPDLLAALDRVVASLEERQSTDPALLDALTALAAQRRPRAAIATTADDGSVRVDYVEADA